MQFIIQFFQIIITNPSFDAFVIIALTNLIRKKFMSDEQTADTEAIEAKQPLYLPRGTIRAIITLILTFIIGGSFIWHYSLPAEFYALAIFAIGYYVGYRTDNSQLPIIKN